MRTSRPRRCPITGHSPAGVVRRAIPMLRMADRDGERIGGIRAEASLQRQERLDHVHDLGLFGCAGSGDSLLDCARRVLEDRCARIAGAAERRRAPAQASARCPDSCA